MARNYQPSKLAYAAIGLAALVGCKSASTDYKPSNQPSIERHSTDAPMERHSDRHGDRVSNLNDVVAEAIAVYKRDIEPDLARKYDGRAEAWESYLKPHIQALKGRNLNSIPSIQKDDLSSMFGNFGYCLQVQNRSNEALRNYNLAIELSAENLGARSNRARVLAESKNYRAALEDFQFLLSRRPNDKETKDWIKYLRTKI